MDVRYVVKSRRVYNGVESTSVVSSPMPRDAALAELAAINGLYQTPGNYYIEKWQERTDA